MHLSETLRAFQQMRHMPHWVVLHSRSIRIVSQTSFGPNICYPPCFRQGCLFHETAKNAKGYNSFSLAGTESDILSVYLERAIHRMFS